MGCDIHFFVERKINGKWESADKITKNKYYDKKYPEEEQEFVVDYEDRFYSGRNYNLFAILADVRNGSGFAGCDTGDGFSPISEPKGIPEDVCSFIQSESDGWAGDGHSHSYFTVEELLAYDWTQTTTVRTMIDLKTYTQWANSDKASGVYPEKSCSGVGGTKINEDSVLSYINETYKPDIPFTKMTWQVMHFVRDKFDEDKIGSFDAPYVKSSFEIPYYNAAENFLSKTLMKMLRLGKQNEVRAVFWFDN